MSKTYHRNKKLEFHRLLEEYENEIGSDLPENCRWLSTNTGWNWDNAMTKISKHKDRHHHSLKREYKKFGLDTLNSWKNPVGERHEQTDRLHKVKHAATHKRRHKLKVEAQRIIKNALNENVNSSWNN